MLETLAIALSLVAGEPVNLPADCANERAEDCRPCLTEDSLDACFWDASTRGNGIGRSFTIHPDGSVTHQPFELELNDEQPTARTTLHPTPFRD